MKLASGLKSNTSLMELNLSGNNIKHNGALALARALEDENTTLETLTLLTQLTQAAIDALRAAQTKRNSPITMALPNHATKLLTKESKEKRVKRKGLRGSIVANIGDINIQGEFSKMANILSNIRFNSQDGSDDDTGPSDYGTMK